MMEKRKGSDKGTESRIGRNFVLRVLEVDLSLFVHYDVLQCMIMTIFGFPRRPWQLGVHFEFLKISMLST